MKNNYRVGTLTSGVTLVLLGVCCGVTAFAGNDIMITALRFWPAILIMLGFELIVTNFREQKPIFDFASVLLMFLCVFFAFGCEFAQLSLTGRAW